MKTAKISMGNTLTVTIFILNLTVSVNAQVKRKSYGQMMSSLPETIDSLAYRQEKINQSFINPQIETDQSIRDSFVEPDLQIASPLAKLIMPSMDAEAVQSYAISLMQSALLSPTDSKKTMSQTCVDHLNETLMALTAGQQWSIKMVDAVGKPPSGMLLGNIQWLGSYDECVNVSATVYRGPNQTDPYSPFKGQYCRVGIPLSAASPPGLMGQASFVLGVCFPSTCSPEDVTNIIDKALSYIPPNVTGNVTLQANDAVCQKDELVYEFRAIAAIIIMSILALLLIAGTAYDVFVIRKLHQSTEPDLDHQSSFAVTNNIPDPSSPDSPVRYRGRISETTSLLGAGGNQNQRQEEETGVCGRVLQAFSVYTNGMKILSAKKQPGTLGALNGVRFISMSWVMLAHSYAFGLMIAANALPFTEEKRHSFGFMAIANATVSVDTFFIISGFLVAYLCLKEIHRAGGIRNFRWGMFYFHRFWRLTPPYMLVIALYVPLLQYWYNGPMWPQEGLEKGYCEDSWWQNILYINNFFPAMDNCMAWSWYLANDMQFYVVSPLLLIPFYHSAVLGGVVSLGFMVMTCTVSGVLSHVNNWPISIVGGGGDPRKAGSYFDDYYVKPYTRIGPYVIGTVLGYILYSCNCKVRMSRTRNILGWLIAAACCIGVLYGPYDTISGKSVSSRNVIALYTAVNRSVWAVGVSWVIFACATGHGGIVNGFLSWKLFIPLSRLTYLAYLVHPVVIFIFYLGKRNLIYVTDMEIVVYYVAFLVISNTVAFVLSLAFESPFMALEKIFLKRERKH